MFINKIFQSKIILNLFALFFIPALIFSIAHYVQGATNSESEFPSGGVPLSDETKSESKFPSGGIPLSDTTKKDGGVGDRGSGVIPSGKKSGVGVSIPNPLGVNSFAELIARINRWLLIIGGPIVTLMMFIGAFQIMTAGGTPEKLTTGRRTITYAIVGYILLLLSTGITFIIKDVLGVK